MATSTPWGKSDHRVSHGRGITFYGTPSHGGFKVCATLNAQIPDALRLADGWYEEDCEWARVALAFPDRFTPEEVQAARSSLINGYPDAAAAFLKREIKLEESRVLRERAFYAAHAADWITIAAVGDWHDAVPAGYVGVTATMGGKRAVYGQSRPPERGFLVPAAEYAQPAPFGFVVDPARHKAWNESTPKPAPLAIVPA